MNQRIRELFEKIETMHNDILTEMIKAEQNLPATDIYESADWIYAFREAEEMFERLKVKAGKLMKTNIDVVCLLTTVQPPNSQIAKYGNVKTDHCTATPEIKVGAHIPKLKYDKEAYLKLMEFIGVDKEVAEAELVRPHWPAMVDYLTGLMQQGKALPQGIDPTKTYEVNNVRVRKKKGVLE